MVFKKSFKLLVATRTTTFFAVVSIILQRIVHNHLFISTTVYEYFEDEKRIFGQTIWLLHSFLRNLNTKRLISSEREDLRGSNFVRFILDIYMFYG